MAVNRKEKLDIIVICYLRSRFLDECLKSIQRNTENFNLITICAKKSAAKNRNEGLKKVKSDWFVMLDDDVIVTPEWLNILLSFKKNDIGQISPKILYKNDRIFSADIELINGHPTAVEGFNKKDNGSYDYVRESELLPGTCSLYNSKILKKCRFDENYQGSQQEDIDFSMQIKEAGFKLLYCGKSQVYHENLKRRSYSELNLTLFKGKWLHYILQKELKNKTILGKIKILRDKLFDHEK